jgi:ribosomal protein S18 acetylase RimI-like enzyme
MTKYSLSSQLTSNPLLRMALKPGGIRGTTAWLVKRVLPIEIFDFFVSPDPGVYEVSSRHNPPSAREQPVSEYSGNSLLTLRSTNDYDGLKETFLNQLSYYSGSGVRSIVRRGGRVYAFAQGDDIQVQLTIDLVGPVEVDTPLPLLIELPEKAAFLGYLFTYSHYRGQGMAQRLIRAAIHDLKAEGIAQVFAHVSASNVNSQNTFLTSGWRRAGLLVSGRHSRVLYQGNLGKRGIRVMAK